ncbi:MAG: DNA alkylation repair protein [Gemmataceae bacterium]
MAVKRKKVSTKVDVSVESVVASLKRLGSQKVRDGLARFGLPSENAFGISMGEIQKLAKQIGKNHALAIQLWESEHYEARLLAAYVAEADKLTPGQMDRWIKDFDSWGLCDTVCFVLFDRTPHAFRKVTQWAKKKAEFEKRAAFALLASLALHDKKTGDEPFAKCLPLIEETATDERNFVKKGVSWALRTVGRRSLGLNKSSAALAKRLVKSDNPAARWIGRDALKELTSPRVVRWLKDGG